MGGLYIHIPFCKKKCRYCDFFSVTDCAAISSYMEALAKEMELREWNHGPFNTIFFGGGTPSLLSPDQIGDILDRAGLVFGICPKAEVSLEANPATINSQNLDAYRQTGVNRISLGIQSMDDLTLRFLGRIHTGAEARQAIKWANSAGYDSVGCDLIYGIPGQTINTWTRDLEAVLEYGPDHLSCYILTIEPSTPLGRMLERGRFRPLDEGRVGDMFLYTSDFLEAKGYIHYEISNFARSREKICRHNHQYWNHSPYLGLGPAAHSYSGEKRQWNVSNLEKYLAMTGAGEAPMEEEELLSESQDMLEWLYLGLRQAAGIGSGDFLSRFGRDFLEVFGQDWRYLQEQGMARDLPDAFALTKKGMLFSDGVCQLLANRVD